MKRAFLFLFSIILFPGLKAQYPFEKYPAIVYKEYKDWKIYDRSESKNKIHYTLTIPGFFKNHDTLTVQLTGLMDHDSCYIRIYRNKNQIQKMMDPWGTFAFMTVEPLLLANVNGDSLSDIKIMIRNNGCGGYNLLTRVIYLFQTPSETFNKVSFTDEIDYEDYRPERDFDGDGNYEIITQTFKNYEDHNYWLYNLYNYSDQKLLNVNVKDNYPIMIQLLYRANFEITNKISRDKMKDFEMKLPDDFSNN